MTFELDKSEINEYQLDEISPDQYVACIHDNEWWVGIVKTVNETERYFKMDLGHLSIGHTFRINASFL